MTIPRMTVLVVGATGSIGCLVVEEALRQGHAVRALVRTPGKARRLPPKAQVVRGDVTRPDTLFAPLDADPEGALDGVHDMANMPLEDEPRPVRDDLDKAMGQGSIGVHCLAFSGLSGYGWERVA
jgi:nucleoside-diphosphate-sugar epimerase